MPVFFEISLRVYWAPTSIVGRSSEPSMSTISRAARMRSAAIRRS